MQLQNYITNVPDFPKPGILFRDLTPLFADPEAFRFAVTALADRVAPWQPEALLAIESRGFILGAALALQLSLPLELARKPGKLPREAVGAEYELEYGSDRLEVHADALPVKRRIAVIDDLLATGGTAGTVIKLAQQAGASIVGCATLVELLGLHGRNKLNGVPFASLIQYD